MNMCKNLIKKAGVAAMTGAMALSMLAPMNAFAATSDYTPVAGGMTTIDKYLVMKEGSQTPNVEFEYTIETSEDLHKAYDVANSKFEVMPGLQNYGVEGAPVIVGENNEAKVAFQAGDAQFGQGGVAETGDYVKNLQDGEVYSKETFTVDFSGVEFSEPGVYRWLVSETASNAQGIINDDDLTRYLDVYVMDVEDEEGSGTSSHLEVQGYILHATDYEITMNETDGSLENLAGDAVAESDYKSQGYTNRYTSHDLVFGKRVSGNQASKDKYFAFTVEIGNIAEGTVVDVSFDDDGNANTTDGYQADITIADDVATNGNTTIAAYRGQVQPQSLVADSNNSISQTFYLRHDQKIALRGLPEGATYTITEAPEDYLPSASVSGDTVTNDGEENEAAIELANNAMADNHLASDAEIGFLNTKAGAIPTGVLMTVIPGVAILAAGVIGGGIAVAKRRKDDDEDEE